MAEKKDTKKDEKKPKESPLGFSPEAAGLAASAGHTALTEGLLGTPLVGLSQLLQGGKDISEHAGTPISWLSEFSGQEARAIKDFAKAQGVKIPMIAAPSSYYMPESMLGKQLTKWFPKLEVAPAHIGLASTALPTAFHEIGHASPVAGSNRLRDIWHAIAGTLGHSPVGQGLRLGLIANLAAPIDEETSKARRFAADYAPHLIGATLVPTIAEEARASAKAIAASKKYGPGVLGAVKNLLPAFGTHLVGAAAPVMAAIMTKKLVDVLRKAEEQKILEKESAAMPGTEVKAPGALRLPASSAWNIGAAPAKPKTVQPSAARTNQAKSVTKANPPSKRSYYRDLITSLHNPQRGFRLAVG